MYRTYRKESNEKEEVVEEEEEEERLGCVGVGVENCMCGLMLPLLNYFFFLINLEDGINILYILEKLPSN